MPFTSIFLGNLAEVALPLMRRMRRGLSACSRPGLELGENERLMGRISRGVKLFHPSGGRSQGWKEWRKEWKDQGSIRLGTSLRGAPAGVPIRTAAFVVVLERILAATNE